MSEKVNIELGEVQKTLLLPLWGRAVESKKARPIMKDETAVRIIDEVNYDFSAIAQNVNPISQLAWIARSMHIDRTVREFIKKRGRASVVYLGCGLDTVYERINCGEVDWYDLDLPDVIELRRKFFSENGKRKFIAASILDDTWLSEIKEKENVLFISAGVLYYFEENQVKNLFAMLKNNFHGCEIFFDAASAMGVKIANKKVIDSSNMNAYLKWGVESAKEITVWDENYSLLEEYKMFHGFKKYLGFRGKIGTFISDYYNIMYMAHLRLG
jgi:O-methyltransferase involved in polyketide biosynthesis